jgi:hypothetical protein
MFGLRASKISSIILNRGGITKGSKKFTSVPIVKDDGVMFIDEKIEAYAEKFTSPQSDLLHQIELKTRVSPSF